jgi:alpha 1,2-mannosyltransferase
MAARQRFIYLVGSSDRRLTTFEDFARDHPQYLSKDNSLRFVSDDGGDSYNLCHCVYPIRSFSYERLSDFFFSTLVWSNFEIADMDFWRGEPYQKFFEYLDNTGGFYYEVSAR